MSAENVEKTLVESQNFKKPISKKKKHIREKQKIDKEKKTCQWTEEMVGYLLDTLTRY